MKKFIAILSLSASLMAAQSSVQAQTFLSVRAAGDTVVNTATVSKIFHVSGSYRGMVVNPKFTKISGTIAGTIKLQASVDGTVYTDVTSQTFTATDIATGQTNWYVSAPLAPHYKVTWTGVSTMSGILDVNRSMAR